MWVWPLPGGDLDAVLGHEDSYIVNIVSDYNRLTVALDLAYDHAYPKAWAAEAAAPMARSPAVDDWRDRHRRSQLRLRT